MNPTKTKIQVKIMLSHKVFSIKIHSLNVALEEVMVEVNGVVHIVMAVGSRHLIGVVIEMVIQVVVAVVALARVVLIRVATTMEVINL